MASENETVEEIVKRVRRDCNSYPLPTAAAEMLKLVREIEAAHKREVAELRECLKDAVGEKCAMCAYIDNEMSASCGEPVCGNKDCKYRKWRKALEGAENEN